jgi:polyhydroxyalkanoate synthesis regulator phasin
MMNTVLMTKVSLLLGTIICLGAFFLIDNSIPVQALHKEEQILEDYDDLAEFANAVRNGDEDLEEIPIQSMEAADIYDDADDNLKDCIDLAAEVGDSLTDREVIHCVDDVSYFETKYSSNSTVPANATFATSTDASETDVDTATDTTSTSDTSDTTSTSDTSDTTSTSDTSDTTSTSDTSDTSDTSTSDDVTGNSLINELVKTGKFTEDEAKEFVSQNMLSAADTTSTSDDTSSNTTSSTNTDDTQATGTDDTQATGTDDTQATGTDDTQATGTDNTTSSNNEGDQDDSSDSNNNGNPEDYDGLSELVNDIKNGVVDTDEISLSDFQNSGAYQGADEQTQDCIDLAAKIGSNLIDYEIVRCSEDPNHFKNQIANNDNNNAESNDDNNDNNNIESDDDTV